MEKNAKKKKTLLIVGIVVAVLVVVYIICIATGNVKPAETENSSSGINQSETAVEPGASQNTTKNEETPQEISSKEPESVTEAYSITLSAGHYTAGVDFPAGKYNLSAVSGGGNVSSRNMYSGGLNEIMGIKDDDMYQKSFNGAVLDKGVVLNIGGSLQLKLDSDAAQTNDMTSRQNTATEEYTLSAGNYTCGTDFEPGEYVITAVSGSGNVSSDNLYDGGLNEIMGTQADDTYITTFNNATFKEGNIITISGVTIKLTPSK